MPEKIEHINIPVQDAPEARSEYTGHHPEILTKKEWSGRKSAHIARIDRLTGDYLEDRRHNRKHPVLDFLFEYYSFRPSKLKQWSPGHSVLLEDAGGNDPFYHEAFTDAAVKSPDGYTRRGRWINPAGYPEKRARFLSFINELLEATHSRPPRFGCFGLHEWAMVYRSEDRRHSKWPLRIDQVELDSFIESQNIACSHFDAFRFFTPDARPLNRIQPTRDSMPANEQSGCLHTNMDLYKWAYKLFPYAGSDLLADAFELALFTRDVDMRASPYDLGSLGYEPIPIETEAGRKEYTGLQRQIHERSILIRLRLMHCVRKLIEAVPGKIPLNYPF